MSKNTDILSKLLKKNFNVDNNDEESLKEFMRAYDEEFEDGRKESRFARTTRGIENIGYALKGVKSAIESLIEPWAKVDEAATKFARTIGTTSAMMKKMRDQAIESVDKNKLAINYGLKAMDLIEAQEKYIKGIGRNVRLDENAQIIAGSISKIIGDTGYELAAAFENFGVDMEVTGEHVAGMYNEAAKKGISLEKYAQNVTSNIKLAQNYTFKNGIQGLESMAKKATALKLDMSQVAAFADKIGTVEGSIESAARLQILGGPFAQFANPLEMLNESLTDMEGLTDRVIKMIGGLGSYDKITGQVKVSPFNKLRVKAAAEAMGMSYDSLMESVNAQGRRKEIERQIKRSAVASRFSDDMKELIMNSATINKEGKAVMNVNGKPLTLDELKEGQYNELVKETQTEAEDIKDIARLLRSHLEKRQGLRDQVDNKLAKWFGGVGEWISGVYSYLGNSNFWLSIIAAATVANTFIGGVRGFRGLKGGKGAKGGGGLFKRFKGAKGAKAPKGGTTAPAGEVGNAMGKGQSFTASNGKTYTIKGGKAYGKNGGVSGKSDQIMREFNKKGAKKAVTKEITKDTTKTVASQAGKGALTAGRFMKAGGALGIAGAAGNMYTDYKVNKGDWEKGGKTHAAMKVGSSAAEGLGWGLFGASLASSIAAGAGAGTTVGPIGTAIGAAAGLITGAVIGGIKVAKARREVALDNKLEQMGIKRKGDYGAHRLKMIHKGLETGKISDSLRMKMEREGDFEILAKIDEARQRAEEKEMKKNGILNGNIKSASISVRSANFNGEAFNTIFGKYNESKAKVSREERESRGLAEKNAAKSAVEPILGPIPATIKAVSEKGENPETVELLRKAAENTKNNKSNNGSQENRGGKYELNISGTIKLEGANGKQVDITNQLLSDGKFIRQIAEKLGTGELARVDKQSVRNEKRS